MNNYFNHLRQQNKGLLDFFQKMPKGGDIHHHIWGAVPAEIFIEKALTENCWIDSSTGFLCRDGSAQTEKDSVLPIAKFLERADAKDWLIRHWTVRNFDISIEDKQDYFFRCFLKTEAVFVGNEAYFLGRILMQAKSENVIYIETLLDVPTERDKAQALVTEFDFSGKIPFKEKLNRHYQKFQTPAFEAIVQQAISRLDDWHREATRMAGTTVRLAFQLYAVRTFDLPVVFAQLVLNYAVAQRSRVAVGVNLVAPEHGEVSLRDYDRHMELLNFLGAQYPDVKLSLHAGELTKELVDKKHLADHIEKAVNWAKAKRIGHGTDIREETNGGRTLKKMADEKIAIEVLLSSNAFILGIEGQKHPMKLYHKHNIPAIIATDDPGIIGITLADEYLKLLESYPEISYDQIKQLVYNSIEYSFALPEDKKAMLAQLDQQFLDFEKDCLN